MIHRERALSFLDRMTAGRVDSTERLPWGLALTTPSLPKIYDANHLQLERWDGSLAELAVEADRVLGAAGCTHRKVLTHDEALGKRLHRLADGDEAWPERGRTVVMTLQRPADRLSDPAIDVATLDADTFRPLVAASVREEPYGSDDEVVDGLVELDRRMASLADTRWYGAIVEGRPVSRTSLYLADGMAQVEDVATLEAYRGRGLARAVVSHAIAEARAAGADPVMIVADLDDWPWQLYEKLGFVRVAIEYTLLRPAA